MYEPYDNFLRVLITVLFETPVRKGKMGSLLLNIVHVNDQTHIFYRTGLYLKKIVVEFEDILENKNIP